MGFSVTETIPVLTVLLQGFLSFFSPCVLPLLPVYIGYLSGGTLTTAPDGTLYYDRKKVLVNTIFFVIGIAFSFFLLGFGLRAVGRFFSGNQTLFAQIGGVIVIIFGLFQLGIIGKGGFMDREHRLPFNAAKLNMSPIAALIMGFVFSFAWTPCVGPTLSGVLLMAASTESSAAGFGLIAVYTAGFVIPFLLTGFFTTSILSLFKKHKNVVRYTAKIGGILLIFMGVMMLTGLMNSFTGYLSRISGDTRTAAEAPAEPGAEQSIAESKPEEAAEEPAAAESKSEEAAEEPAAEEEEGEIIPAPDFTLKDQYGNTHTLSDYKGRIVFLNFWATWCPPCREEMPDIEAIYQETQADPDSDLVILGVAFPGYGDETDEAGVAAFLEQNGYTYPVVMDTEAELLLPYYISAYPTTYMIDPEGNIFGYVAGSMTKHTMESIIDQTREGVREQ